MPFASARPRLRPSVAAAAATAAVAALAFAPQAAADTGVSRFGGSDRYATAAQTALHAFGPDSRPDTVFIASGQDYPDALAAGAAAQGTFGNPAPGAGHFGSVLLLTQPGGLPAATADALDQLDPRRIVVVGGPGAVSGDVVRDLQSGYSASIERWAGDDRYETAAEVSENIRQSDSSHVDSGYVFVATGENYADAVTAGSIAGQFDAPLLLVREGGIDAEVSAELDALDPDRIVVAGGPAVISDSVARQLGEHGAAVTRAAGSDRYATSIELVEYLEDELGSAQHGTAVASGLTYADALAASNLWEPVVLTQPAGLPSSIDRFFDARDIAWIDIVGGPGVVSSTVEDQLAGLVSGVAAVGRTGRSA